jgi:ATP dependent DNA ligase-like protein
MAEAMLPGFIPPCLPTKAKEPPCGGLWWHEIKHDGFRIIARKEGSRVRLFTRNGRVFTHRFPLIVDALAALRSRSCILDGEAVACGNDGMPSFDRIRYRRRCCDCSRSVFTGSIVQAYGDGVKDRPRSIQRTAVYGPVCTVVAPRVVLATDRGKRIPGRSARTARSTSQLSTPARSSPLPSSVGYTTATRGYSFWEGQVRARGQAFGVIGPSRSLMKTCADCPCSR